MKSKLKIPQMCAEIRTLSLAVASIVGNQRLSRESVNRMITSCCCTNDSISASVAVALAFNESPIVKPGIGMCKLCPVDACAFDSRKEKELEECNLCENYRRLIHTYNSWTNLLQTFGSGFGFFSTVHSILISEQTLSHWIRIRHMAAVHKCNSPDAPSDEIACHRTTQCARTKKQTFCGSNFLQIQIRHHTPFHQFQIQVDATFGQSIRIEKRWKFKIKFVIARGTLTQISFTFGDPCSMPSMRILANIFLAHLVPSQSILPGRSQYLHWEAAPSKQHYSPAKSPF